MLHKRNFGRLHQRIQKSYKMHKEKPLPVDFKPRLCGPPATWKIFRRLQMATVYSDSCTKDCMVFSFEEKLPESNGQRLFLVTHPQHMWLNHRLRPLEERCSYEVIREGFPCKLYFDLEYHKSYNPNKDGIKMTDIFIKCIIAAMVDRYNLRFQISDFLWLDGSTEQKYSCHLILQMGNNAFQDNIQAGLFVSSLLFIIEEKIKASSVVGEWPSSEELKTLFVSTKNGKRAIFCDNGVYTKNRNFRLYLSTKFGKRTPLILSKFNLYKPSARGRVKDANENIFYDSLITYFGNENNIANLLTWAEENISRMSPKEASAKFKTDKESFTGCTLSPFPDLDSFILAVVRDDFIVGFVRKWTYYYKEQIIIYDIGNYRFCQNIGRHHKSNNIRLVVDMKENIYYQKCYDPECQRQNYRSEAIFIPDGVLSLNVPDDFFDDNCFSQLENTDTNESSEKTTKDAVKLEKDTLDNNIFENITNSCEFSQIPSVCIASVSLIEEADSTVGESDGLQELIGSKLCENLASDFDFETDEIEQNNDKNDSCFTFNLPETFWSELTLDSCTTNLCASDIPDDEEMIMVEAAAVVEATSSDSLMSEETIF